MERAWWLLGSEGGWAGWGREPVGAPQGQQMGAAAPARKKPTIWPPGALDLQRRSGRARRSWGSVNRCFWLQEEKGTPGREGKKNSSQLGRAAVFSEELSQKEPRNLPHSPPLPLPSAGQHLWGRRGSAEVQGVFLLVPNLALTFLLSFYVAVLWQGGESSSQGGDGSQRLDHQLSRLGLRGGTGKEVVPHHPFPLKPTAPAPHHPLTPLLGAG